MAGSICLRGIKESETMDYTEILSVALGIEKPWIISKAGLEPTEKGEEMHACPVCGRKYALAGFAQTKWRHFNFFQYPCYIHAETPVIKCNTHGLQFIKTPQTGEGRGLSSSLLTPVVWDVLCLVRVFVLLLWKRA